MIYVIQLAFEIQILSDSINDNNLAEDLIRNLTQFYRFKNNLNESFTLIQLFKLSLCILKITYVVVLGTTGLHGLNLR